MLFFASAGCASETPAGPPTAAATVVLVTWDTVRADRVGAYGATTGATPVLDALARAGLVCETARAPAPITLVSHATLLTGTMPLHHGVHDNGGYRLAPESVLLAEVLADAGHRTGAFVGAFVLDAVHGLDQGFEIYGTPAYRRLGLPLQGAERPATEVVDQALAWLDGVAVDEPVLLWAHFYEPHFAYLPPEPFAARFADPYDGEIAACDAELGRLLAGLDAAGRAGRRLVIVTSDHGEAFGEHGEATHGVFVYEATQHVPLVLHGTDVPSARLTGPVSLVDVAPTILHWAGLPPESLPRAEGLSLLGQPAVDDARPLLFESWLPWHAHGWMPERALLWRGYKYVAARQPELYTLASDPAERDNLAAAQPELTARFARELVALEERSASPVGTARRAVSPDEDERLAALGYFGGGARSAVPHEAPDARTMLPQLAARDRALRLLWLGRVRMGFAGVLAVADADPQSEERQAQGRAMVVEAAALLRAQREQQPGDPGLAKLLGLAAITLGNFAEAVTCFEEHLAAEPSSAVSNFNLAVALDRVGQPDTARVFLLRAVELEPRATMATHWLAQQEVRRGEWGHAAFFYERLREAVGELEDELAPLDEARRQAHAEAAAAGLRIAPPPDWP